MTSLCSFCCGPHDILFTCGYCAKDQYCGRACQAKHYTIHERTCVSVNPITSHVDQEIDIQSPIGYPIDVVRMKKITDRIAEIHAQIEREHNPATEGPLRNELARLTLQKQVERRDYRETLILAVRHGDISTTQIMLDFDITLAEADYTVPLLFDVHTAGWERTTFLSALIVAITFAKQDIMKLLLQAGVQKDVLLSGLQGVGLRGSFIWGVRGHYETALTYAINGKPFDISSSNALLLLAAGANPNIANKPYGISPLISATRNGFVTLVNALIEKGANVNAVSMDGRTALIEAAEMGHSVIGEILLAAGANIDNPDGDGRTALNWATDRQRNEMVALLLRAGADRNLRDDQWRLPRALAKGDTRAIFDGN